MPGLLDSFQFYQLQVTVPEEKCSVVVKKITDTTSPITKVHASQSFVLFARVPRAKLAPLLADLDLLGLGTQFGIVEVLPLALAMPLFFIEEGRKEKEKQKAHERKKQAEAARPRVDSLFAPLQEEPKKPTSSIGNIFDPVENTIKKSLVGAWEKALETAPPLQLSPRKKGVVKSPRKHSHRHAKETKHTKETHGTDGKSNKGKSHHKRTKSPRRGKEGRSDKPAATLLETLVDDEEDTKEEGTDRLLWGPMDIVRSKSHSVDFSASPEEKSSLEQVQRTKTGPTYQSKPSSIRNEVKLTSNKQSDGRDATHSPLDIDFGEVEDLAEQEFVFDEEDKGDVVSFVVGSDDDDPTDELPFIIEDNGAVKKGMDTDDEGEDVVFTMDGDDDDDQIAFTIDDDENAPGGFSLAAETSPPRKENIRHSAQIKFSLEDEGALHFDMDAEDSSDNDVKITIDVDDLSSSKKSSTSSTRRKKKSSQSSLRREKRVERSEPQLRKSQDSRMRDNNSTITNKGRTTSLNEEEKKPLDSVEKVQDLFRIKEDKKAKAPLSIPPVEKSTRSGSTIVKRPRTIVAEQFIVQDTEGNERGRFGLSENNGISLELSDSSSRRNIHINISSMSDTEMGIQFIVDGKTRLSHFIDAENDIESALYGTDFESNCKMTVNTNSPELTLGIKDQTLINLRGTEHISELNPSNALVSLRSDPGFSGLSICDIMGATRATFGWYDLKKLLRLEKETDLVMIQMSGKAASQDLDNFPETTISVIDNVAKVYAKDKSGGINEFPPRVEEDDVSVLVNIEKGGAQLGLVNPDGSLRTLSPAKTQQVLNAYGFNL